MKIEYEDERKFITVCSARQDFLQTYIFGISTNNLEKQYLLYLLTKFELYLGEYFYFKIVVLKSWDSTKPSSTACYPIVGCFWHRFEMVGLGKVVLENGCELVAANILIIWDVPEQDSEQ